MKKALLIMVLFMLFGVLLLWLLFGGSDTSNVTVAPGVTTKTFDITPTGNTSPVLSREKIQEGFNDFLLSDTAFDTWTQFFSEGEAVPLQEGLSALGADVNPQLDTLLDQKQWKLFKCPSNTPDDVPGIVLSMYFKFNPQYVGNLYEDQNTYLKKWEETLFNNVQSILFPNYYYEISLSQDSAFYTNADYPFIDLRQAKVRLPNNAIGYIGYIFVGDELLVGNDLECLTQAQEILFDTSA